MKRLMMSAVLAGVLAAGPAVFGADQGEKADKAVRPEATKKVAPVPANNLEMLLRPELVMKNAAELGLTKDQQEAMRKEVQESRQNLAASTERLRAEMAALNKLLSAPTIDRKEAVAQLDRVLDAEREIKKENLTLALTILGELTPEQREKAKSLTKGDGAKATAIGGQKELTEEMKAQTLTLRSKMQELQALAKQRQAEGKDISEARKAVETVKGLVQEGKMKEAEEALDKAKDALK